MSAGSDLCTQCGLCCTGALHDNAVAQTAEIEQLRSRGFEISSAEKHLFPLPCGFLKGTSCSIYHERPRACSNYRCRLLQEVEAGTTDAAAAIMKVHEAQRLLKAVLTLLPAGLTLPQARALRRSEAEPRLQLQVLALMRYLDQNFRHEGEGPLLREVELTAVESAGESSERVTQDV